MSTKTDHLAGELFSEAELSPPAGAPTREDILRERYDNRKPATNAGDLALVESLLVCWKAAVQPRAQLTPGRRKRIRDRLREGYTPSQVLKALEGITTSDFHMGRKRGQPKKYNDVSNALGPQMDRFIEEWDAREEAAPKAEIGEPAENAEQPAWIRNWAGATP